MSHQEALRCQEGTSEGGSNTTVEERLDVDTNKVHDVAKNGTPMAGFQGACAAVGMQGMRRVGQWLRRNLTL
jgi:hypothetical protein